MEEYTHEDYLKLEAEFREKESQMKKKVWIDNHIGEMNELLRSNYNKSVKEFCEIVIKYVSELTNAFYGIFYTVNAELELVEALAGFACKAENFNTQKFKFGDSVIGQVALSKKTVKFDNIARNSNNETAFVGQLEPNAIIIVPLLFNQAVQGVLELSFLNNIDASFENFLNTISPSIAAILESIINKDKMRALLEDAQVDKEKLLAQEEELRQNLEEMAATREAQDQAQIKMEKLKSDLENNNKLLKQSTKKFELTAETTVEGLWEIDLPENLDDFGDNSKIWWSDKFQLMLGYQPGELAPYLGAWVDILHPDDSERAGNAFEAHLMDTTGNTPYDVEYRLKIKDKGYEWFSEKSNCVRDENGKPLYAAGAILNINDKKNSLKIHESIELLENISSEAFWFIDLVDGDALKSETKCYWSNNFLNLLGYEKNDFLDNWESLIKITHSKYKRKIQNKITSIIQGENFSSDEKIECKLKQKNGKYQEYSLRLTTIKDEKSVIEKIIGNLLEINKS